MKKFFKILLVVVIIAIFFGTLAFLWQKSKTKEIIYDIIEVTSGDIEKSTIAPGKVEPRDEILIKPQVSGIISEVLVEAGDNVKAGDIIAVVKVVPEMSNLSSAESSLNLSIINLEKAQIEFDRQNKLHQSGVISKEDFENAETQLKRSKEEADNAQDRLDIIKDGISKKFAQYSNTQVRATITGMVLDVPIKVGNSVIQANTFNDGTTIASIANMNDIIFKGNVDETEIGRINVRMPISLTIGALQGYLFDAVLEYISPKGVETNGANLFEIRAAVNVPDSVFIRAGYSANAQITLQKSENVTMASESAIEFQADTSYVYRLISETPQKFEKEKVTLGLSDGINIEIKEGVKIGDKLRGSKKIL
ncbi:MAG: efflux RND transporter periplasmic adaptor subunit [Bacteroidales bacterium]|jgi:HlyD family secretion protein|nr:efflux RND transporter periplasmic adaptor subunit [Bacteroidales bacterium]